MNVLGFDYDTEHGFAWINVEGKQEGEEYIVQCCLKDRTQEQAENNQDFDAVILAGDCGHDEGICGDANEKAFDHWGENRCMKALFKRAAAEGLEVEGI